VILESKGRLITDLIAIFGWRGDHEGNLGFDSTQKGSVRHNHHCPVTAKGETEERHRMGRGWPEKQAVRGRFRNEFVQ
jgi:hypothetical protein